MRHDRDWVDYFTERLAEAEKALAGFENAVAQHGLRIFERDQNGERDVTGRHRKILQDEIEEYRKCLRDDHSTAAGLAGGAHDRASTGK